MNIKSTIHYIIGSILIAIYLPAHSEASDTEISKYVAYVENAINETSSANALWRDTYSIFEQAKLLIRSGQVERAKVLLDQSLHQAETAINQANTQQNQNIIPYYLRK